MRQKGLKRASALSKLAYAEYNLYGDAAASDSLPFS
jgi:hypothetical protein